jgi:serine/threonine protein kinase
VQIKDLNSGTFGFVQLARDKSTGELIAVKFIERGEKVRTFVWRSNRTANTLNLDLLCCAFSWF